MIAKKGISGLVEFKGKELSWFERAGAGSSGHRVRRRKGSNLRGMQRRDYQRKSRCRRW